MSTSEEVKKLLNMMVRFKASDLHLKHNRPPIFRVFGRPIVQEKLPPYTGDRIEEIISGVISEEQLKKYQRNGVVEFSIFFQEVGRFRFNCFRVNSMMSVTVRYISVEIPTVEDLMLPEAVKKITTFNEGLVLVAGITGSGKSTTLAALLEFINQNKKKHIITLEDPVEYSFEDKKSFFNQRELGNDIPNFSMTLKYILRQDPDIILIGELRDMETIETALTAAETGHLVFATIHASSATQVFSRILDTFPAERHTMVRQMLNLNIKAILCQKLIRGIQEAHPRVPAVELMFMNSTFGEAILEGREEEILGLIKRFKQDGMVDFNSSLYELVNKKMIDPKEARAYSPNPEALKMLLRGFKSNE